ncbi:MAG: glycosyltransferase family 2 protein [Janthinobacterium lividum]
MNGTALLTIAAGRHEHLRGQLEGLRRSTSAPTFHVVAAMGDPLVHDVVAQFDQRSSPTRTVVIDVAVPPDGELPLARARNLAAATALDLGADLLVLLDVDCIPAPATLAAYRWAAGQRQVREAPAPVLLSGAVHYLPERAPGRLDYPFEQLPSLARPHPARPAPAPGELLRASADQRWLFWSLSFAVTALDWIALGGFCEEFTGYGAEDTDLAAVLDAAGGTMFWVGGADAFHQHHPTQNPPVQHLEAVLRNAATFHRRWGWFPMQGWLEEFRSRGLVTYDAASSTWALSTASRR